MTYRLTVPAVAVLAAVLGVAGCSSGSGTTATGTTGGASPAAAPTSSAPTSSAPASIPPATKASGFCRIIDQAAAAGIVGFPVKAGISSGAGVSKGGIQKVDDCTYLSAGSGSLGYTVLKVPASAGQTMIAAAQARMAAAQSSGSPAKAFQAGLPQSLAFTMTLPKGVDAQIAVLNGEQFITVAVTRTDADVAKSQAEAIAAAKVLIGAS
ncbi:MAG: hypothetical protein ACYDDW_17265 [Dermatophilaceae bacterium]